MMEPKQNTQVWRQLMRGGSLEGLGLARKDGRWDLSGLRAPQPERAGTSRFGNYGVDAYQGIVKLKGIAWHRLDFSGAMLEHLRFSGCEIDDCIFNNAKCEDWRLWTCVITDCSFAGANLRSSALGPAPNGQQNIYRRVDFTRTNLLDSSYLSAVFAECLFQNAKLNKVDFGGSIFSDCQFVGLLNEVEFYRTAFNCPQCPPNEMLRVDFSRAQLRWVEFRGLDLDSVRFPEDDLHIIITPYVNRLEQVLAAVRSRSDVNGRLLTALFENMRKWAGPNQRRGVLNKLDLVEAVGEEETQRLLPLLVD